MKYKYLTLAICSSLSMLNGSAFAGTVLLANDAPTQINQAPQLQNGVLQYTLNGNMQQTLNTADLQRALQSHDVDIQTTGQVALPQVLDLGSTTHRFSINAHQLAMPNDFTIEGGRQVILNTDTFSPQATGTYFIDKATNTELTVYQHPNNFSQLAKIKSNTAIATNIPIYTLQDLQNISQNLAGHYVLMNNINAAGHSIGSFITKAGGTAYFQGTFNGQGYTISNLNVQIADGLWNNVHSLFGNIVCQANSSSIENVTFSNVTLNNAVALLADELSNGNQSTPCITQVTVRNMQFVSTPSSSLSEDAVIGGLVALSSGSSVTHVLMNMNYGNLGDSGYIDIGGIVGDTDTNGAALQNDYIHITPATSNSTLSAQNVGGTIAELMGGATFQNVGVSGTLAVSGSVQSLGGLIASANGANLTDAYSNVSFTALGSVVNASNGIGNGLGDTLNNIYIIPSNLPTVSGSNASAGILLGFAMGATNTHILIDSQTLDNQPIMNDSTTIPAGVNVLSDTQMQTQSTYSSFDFGQVWFMPKRLLGTHYFYPYFQFQESMTP